MRETITFSAPQGTRKKLDAEARRRHCTRSSVLLELFHRNKGLAKSMPKATRRAIADARAGRGTRFKSSEDYFRAVYG